MFVRRFTLTLWLALIALLSGCGHFDFTGQELGLKHDAEADTLEFELRYHGVQALASDPIELTTRQESTDSRSVAKSNGKLARATKMLAAMLEGERTFVIGHPALVFELDQENDVEQLTQFERRTWNWLQGVSMRECRLELDESGELSLYQRLHMKQISKGIVLLNEGYCHSITMWSQEADFVKETSDLDAASRKALVAAAASGVGPFELVDGALIMTFPINGASMLHILGSVAREFEDDEAGYWALLLDALLSPVDEFEVHDGQVKLRYEPGEDGVLRMDLPSMRTEYDPALREHLRAEDLELPRHFVAEE